MILGRVYSGFCVGMGIYGYTRGFRSEYKNNSKKLITEKLSGGLFNALFYAAPIVNLWPTLRLIDRLEIEYKNLDKTKYKGAYQELVGQCNDTL